MHDVSPVVWSEPVYKDVLETFEDQKTMTKSDSFSVAAPAGPAKLHPTPEMESHFGWPDHQTLFIQYFAF